MKIFISRDENSGVGLRRLVGAAPRQVTRLR
jgi:hypothetical protein